MGGYLLMLGTLALCFSYSKRSGWDRDCLVGAFLCTAAGITMLVLE